MSSSTEICIQFKVLNKLNIYLKLFFCFVLFWWSNLTRYASSSQPHFSPSHNFLERGSPKCVTCAKWRTFLTRKAPLNIASKVPISTIDDECQYQFVKNFILYNNLSLFISFMVYLLKKSRGFCGASGGFPTVQCGRKYHHLNHQNSKLNVWSDFSASFWLILDIKIFLCEISSFKTPVKF